MRGHLAEVSFAEKAAYEALSYTWGDQSRKKPFTLIVNPGEPVRRFNTISIGDNLWSALRIFGIGSGAGYFGLTPSASTRPIW